MLHICTIELRDKCSEGLNDLWGVSPPGTTDFDGPQLPDEGLDDGRGYDAEACHREDGRCDVRFVPR